MLNPAGRGLWLPCWPLYRPPRSRRRHRLRQVFVRAPNQQEPYPISVCREGAGRRTACPAARLPFADGQDRSSPAASATARAPACIAARPRIAPQLGPLRVLSRAAVATCAVGGIDPGTCPQRPPRWCRTEGEVEQRESPFRLLGGATTGAAAVPIAGGSGWRPLPAQVTQPGDSLCSSGRIADRCGRSECSAEPARLE